MLIFYKEMHFSVYRYKKEIFTAQPKEGSNTRKHLRAKFPAWSVHSSYHTPQYWKEKERIKTLKIIQQKLEIVHHDIRIYFIGQICLIWSPGFTVKPEKTLFKKNIAINTPLVTARNFKNCLNHQFFIFLMVIERLTCDVRHLLKSKHKSNLKLWLFIRLALFLMSLKIWQEELPLPLAMVVLNP